MLADTGRAEPDWVVGAIQADPQLTGGRFIPDPDRPIETVVPGVMYRYPEQSSDQRTPVALTVYLGLGELGAALWDQELTTLERLNGLGSKGLPTLLDGGYLQPVDGHPDGAAFVRTRAAESLLDPGDGEGRSDAVAEFFCARPAETVRHLWLLADALSAIHDCRIVHRNLWPGALQFDAAEPPDDAPDAEARIQSLELARFELSGLFANLLRSWRPGRAGPDDIRGFLLAQPPRSRVYASPERLRFMFGTDHLGVQDFSSDVFSLGMIAVEWLLGPEALGRTRDKPDYEHLQGVLGIHRQARGAVARSALPRELRTLLGEMIAENPPRPSAYEVVRRFGQLYDTSLLSFSGDNGPTGPHLVGYQAGEDRSDKTLFQWGYLANSSGTPEGVAELEKLIESDMRGARVLYSPHGAAPFVVDRDEKRARSATAVVEGREFVWFLAKMFKRRGLATKHYDEIQIIRYVVRRSPPARSLERFLQRGIARRLGDVEAIDHALTPDALDRHTHGRPNWDALLDSLKVDDRALDDTTAKQQRAMELYLDYQTAMLRSREYAYRTVDSEAQGRVQIVADPESEDARRHRITDSLTRYVVGSEERPDLADFVLSNLEDESGAVFLQFAAEGSNLRHGVKARVDSVRDKTIVLDARELPPTGWLRLEADGPTDAQVRNQHKAVDELAGRRDLLSQLASPRSTARNRHRWESEGVAAELQGEGAEIVREMLAHETFFVLQGPPGTGKTTITSQAVAAFLKQEEGARILVSAQSHDALDNLAERILTRLGLAANGANGTHTAVRVTSRHSREKVSAAVARFREEEAVEDLAASVRAAVRRSLARRPPQSAALRATLEEWLGLVDRVRLDLTARLRRGANLVFATTGAATESNLVGDVSEDPFDWVVIEEAARAWPTELALPMTRGSRWTLIGDQAQIGAYGRSDVERLLASFENDQDPDLVALYARREEVAARFALFSSFFAIEGTPSWRRTLTQQYRMDDRIADIVSTAFYQASGGLSSPVPRRPHGLRRPAWVADEAVVWVDTGRRRRAVPRWSNDAEAREAAELARLIGPVLDRDGRTLAVLTPYREQVDMLCRNLAERAKAVSTVDAFQGREADVVLVSLVRDQLVDGGEPSSNIGHIADPGRANVLLSRARELLVIIGNLDLFEHHAGEDWASIAATVRANGRVVPLAEAGLT